jgi:hypothetical protein
LIEADLIRPFTGDGSPDLLVLTPTTPVMIGGVSYGREIPTQAGPEWSNGPEHALRILITHHDLEFPGNKIPNAAPVRHIKDIDLTINGHVHDCRQPIKTRGRDKSTACWHFNPGNITRCSIDLEGHVPSVFSLIPERDEEIDPILGVCLPFGMRRHILNYAPEIFDHTGRRIVSETPEAGSLLKDSDFVDLLRDEVQAPETQDASILSDELKVIFERLDTKAPLRELLLLLADPTEADPNSIKIANIS